MNNSLKNQRESYDAHDSYTPIEDELELKKDKNVYQIRFSNGPSSFFYDAIDELLLNTFKTDIEKDFDFFYQLSLDRENDGDKNSKKS